MIEVGVAVIDITPSEGIAMAGFAARRENARGAHDTLTVRALVVGETALVTADVIGIDAALSKRVRNRSCLPDEAITIVAAHTHGAPASMPGRLASDTDPNFLDRLENGLIEAIDSAAAARKAARLYGGVGADPGFARNRRHKNGEMDRGIPVLRIDDSTGKPMAILVSYACHPVVLGADNLLWTADYIHYFRKELESACPGAVAIFATGCAGDANTGHSAASSLLKDPSPSRSFATAETIGTGLARSVLSVRLQKLGHQSGAAEKPVELEFLLRETKNKEILIREWRAQAESDEGRKAILDIWIDWAENKMGRNTDPVTLRCSALHWGGAVLIGLPGEIFAETALKIRKCVTDGYPVFLMAYADDNPGYIPPESEYRHGGYEIDEAHRFYGLGATFAPGSAERLEQAGREAAEHAAIAAAQETPVNINKARERGNHD